jgi:phage baseplate assembly protein W
MALTDTTLVLDIETIEDDSSDLTRTYKMDFENNRIMGFTDGLDALQQAITKILFTERFKNLIYSNEYGSEVKACLMSDDCTNEFLNVEIPALIKEALMQDVRILDVDEFNLKFEGDCVHIECDVTTIYGNIEVKAVV